MLLPFDIDAFRDVQADFDRWATRFDERIISRRWSGRLRRSLEAETVAASTSMEGVPVTVTDALRILAGDEPEDVAPKDRALVLGYHDAMRYVQRRADDGLLEWNRELVVGVQDRVLAGDFGTGAGRLRTRATWIRNDQSGAEVFAPPQHELVPELIDEVCATVRASDWHPIVTAAWLHVALAAVHPFLDGNGRTARVLASLAMYRGGFRHPAFTSLEEWWGRHPREYYAAFDCLGREFDRATDVTPFIRAHIQAQRSQVLGLALRQRTEGRLWTTLENLLDERGLPTRLANALYDSFFGRDVTTSYYLSLIDASPATARNDLNAAAGAGFIRAQGRTRGRRFTRGPALIPAIAEQLGNTAPEFDAIGAELVRRTADQTDWPAPPEPEPPHQPRLPGIP